MDLDSVSPFSSLQALAKLLADPQEEDSDDNDFGSHSSSVSTVGPGNIGAAKKAEPTVTPDVKSGNSKDIWNTEEVPEGSEFDDIWDPREQPELKSNCQIQSPQTLHLTSRTRFLIFEPQKRSCYCISPTLWTARMAKLVSFQKRRPWKSP
ncbi:cytochrome c oxidase protein 20-like protein [Platysternon megacephalum]|uniref:Cytochrome c oxidase protein 20-like protein n=1 Tax=Platysternon megacephalum TaxID=55544 RepID=A0A4D9EAR2_9SAUR|nr:cytochrome c oxidase protein 20-like protein [Platysternon megacephalum]